MSVIDNALPVKQDKPFVKGEVVQTTKTEREFGISIPIGTLVKLCREDSPGLWVCNVRIGEFVLPLILINESSMKHLF